MIRMLEIKKITKQYGNKYALQDVSLSLSDGIYGLLGPNGAGKTTLMNIITDNLQPDSGEVFWKDTAIKTLGAKYRSILGYAPQQQGLYESFTGRRFLSYMAALKAIPKKEMGEEIERVAEYVNLIDKIDTPIGSYSGGMKQRILIAQAMMGRPKLMIMDEPTAGLDPKERVRIREKIKELSQGKIILMATHVVSDIQSIAKEIIILKSGKVVSKDSVANLCEQYGDVKDLEDVYMKIFGEDEDHG